MKTTLSLLCLLLLAVSAPARIGETFQEIKARMGEPAETGDDYAVWKFPNGLWYSVTLDKNARSTYESITLKPLEGNFPLPSERIVALFEANRVEIPVDSKRIRLGMIRWAGLDFAAEPGASYSTNAEETLLGYVAPRKKRAAVFTPDEWKADMIKTEKPADF